MDLRTALSSQQNAWLDEPLRRGFLRTIVDPLNEDDDVHR
jgi:hypothetical protein